METRIGFDTLGKHHTFKVDGVYYNLFDFEKAKDVFKGWKTSDGKNISMDDFAACLIHTKVVRDSGYRIEMRYGCPTNVYYDNGLVGYQNYDFFKTIKEAKDAFKTKREVTFDNAEVKRYVDVFVVINPKFDKQDDIRTTKRIKRQSI